MEYLLPVTESEMFGLWATCPECRWSTGVNGPDHHTSPGLVADHLDREGVYCHGSGRAVSLQGVEVRDGRPSPAEHQVKLRTVAWLSRCRGWVELADGSRESCAHPVCHGRKR